MIAIAHPIHYRGNALNFFSPRFLQILPEAAKPVIEYVIKDSSVERRIIIGGTVSVRLHSVQHIVPMAQFL